MSERHRHLTDAEQVETLIDAIVLHEQRRRRTEAHAELIGFGRGDPSTAQEQSRLDQLVDEETRAQEEVVARVRVLMGGGLLSRCAAMLRRAGREAV